MPPSHLLLIASAIIAHVTFAWAFVRRFVRPTQLSIRARTLGLAGLVCQVVHLSAVIIAPAGIVRRLTAMLLYACSLGLFQWALSSTSRAHVRLPLAFSALAPATLVMDGAYRSLRHPIYSSYMLAWTAGSVGTDWPFAWLALAVMGVQYGLAAREEERDLAHGPLQTQYLAYRGRTPAVVPPLVAAWRRIRSNS